MTVNASPSLTTTESNTNKNSRTTTVTTFMSTPKSITSSKSFQISSNTIADTPTSSSEGNAPGTTSPSSPTTTSTVYMSFVTFTSKSISRSECIRLNQKQMNSIIVALGQEIKKRVGRQELPGYAKAIALCGSIIIETALDIKITGIILNLLRVDSLPVVAMSRTLEFEMVIYEGTVLELTDPSVSEKECKDMQNQQSFTKDLLSTIAASVKSAIDTQKSTVVSFDLEREITELGQVLCESAMVVRLPVHQNVKKTVEDYLEADYTKIAGISLNRKFAFRTFTGSGITTLQAKSLRSVGGDAKISTLTLVGIACAIALVVTVVGIVTVACCILRKREYPYTLFSFSFC